MRAFFRALHFVSYLVFRHGELGARLLPWEWTFLFGQIGGELAYRVLRRRRALALRNLRLAFGRELSERELQALNRRHFHLLGANLFSGLKASTLPGEKIWERVSATLPETRPKTGWIALVSHLGNWELYGHLGQRFPEYRFGSVYQPLANPFIDRHLRRARAASGIVLFDRRNELLSCARFLQEGGTVGVLSDQGAGYAGLWTPLFGRLTSSSTLAARLAVRTRAPIVPLAIRTCGRARWELVISQPVSPDHGDPEKLTAELNRVLEQQIRRSPADWLWAHNRWKPLRPHFLFAHDRLRTFLPPDVTRAALDPFRVLVISPAQAEQARATFAAVRAIKEGRPDIWMAALVSTGLRREWETNEAVDYLLEWQAGDSVSSLTAKIRDTAPFDVAIFFATDWKPCLASWRAGIPLRVGLRSGAGRWFCNQHPLDPAPSLGPRELSLHIARSVGAQVSAPAMEPPAGLAV